MIHPSVLLSSFSNSGEFFNKQTATIVSLLILVFSFSPGNSQSKFPFTSSPLTEKGDLSAIMVEGINSFLAEETSRLSKARPTLWKRDFSSPEAFHKSISSQRDLLATRLGVVEKRVNADLEVLSNSKLKQFVLESNDVTIRAVRWKAIDGLSSEGLLLQPKGKVLARMVMIPDADVLPEVLAGIQQTDGLGFGAAQQLAKAGFEILIPTLVSRDDTFSKNPSLGLSTKLPHREWIYRQSYEVGRHVIGYELQKIFSAIDWLESRNKSEGSNMLIGVAGHGEGGLLALNAAALDDRISSTLVSGYFDAREQLWREPIYRNVFGLLKTFGDAELAVMAWPRALIVEHAKGPEFSGSASGSAPGVLVTPDLASSQAEFERAKALLPAQRNHLQIIHNNKSALQPFSPVALEAFAKGVMVKLPKNFSSIGANMETVEWVNATSRQERTVKEMEDHVQQVLRLCERTRNEDFWSSMKGDLSAQEPVKAAHRERLWNVLGRLPTPTLPSNPKARLIEQTDKWTSYEITLDVFGPQVYAWGILIIPKGIKSGERRATVVCQHGLEGVPMDAVNNDSLSNGYKYYKGFATKLAERGYVTFAPHNPYRGQDKFRVIQRRGNPLGLTLFSVIISQHERIVEWLKQQSFIDPNRIGFYGLSYGGKSAMRIPAIVEGYALSICSADFNEWVRKVATTNHWFGYIFHGEYDMPEWDLGHTFNYAEMAGLIAPRPFMVERGYYDKVGVDEWVDYEFAKVRRHFDILGLEKSVRIEHFVGPHTINGIGTFEFLDLHLKHSPSDALMNGR